MTSRAISIRDKFSHFTAQWTPHRIATFDDYQILVARVDGDFVWHQHDDHDEVFLVMDGRLLIEIEGQDSVQLEAGEICVVPRGVPHRPRAQHGECKILILDPLSVKHTGDVDSSLTVRDYPSI